MATDHLQQCQQTHSQHQIAISTAVAATISKCQTVGFYMCMLKMRATLYTMFTPTTLITNTKAYEVV